MNTYVWRVVVTDNGGNDARPFVPEQGGTEPDTGAWVEAYFWPPRNGEAKRYLSRSGAVHRQEWWLANGVKSERTRSLAVAWPEPEHLHDGTRADKAIRPRGAA